MLRRRASSRLQLLEALPEYYYYYYYCYYYYCRDPMSSTQNPTVLYGVQVLQTIVYYTYMGTVFNNFGTVTKTILSLHHDAWYANMIGRVAPKV